MKKPVVSIRRPNLGKLFSNKRFTIIISLVLAVIFWFVTVGIYDPDSSVIIENVPITVDTTGTQAQQLDLDVSQIEPATVSVTVSGPRYKLASLNQDSFVVSPTTLSGITGADTYNLPLQAELRNSQSDVQISLVSPSQASVTFDTVDSKTITLSAEAPNVKVSDGYILESPVAQPERLTVEGPESSINALTEIKLIVDASTTLTANKTFDATPHFIASDGSEMDASLFTYNTDIRFKVTVPVYEQKSVPLTFKFKNAPSCLDTSKLSATISPASINIAGTSDAVDNLSEVSLGYIDMRELDIGKSFTLSVSLPSGFKNLDGVDTATVTFDSSNWGSKLLTVSDIQISNPPADYDVSITSSAIKDIKIVGDKDVIAGLTPADVTATVDLTSQTVQSGKQTVSVTIGILSKDGVWPVGEYTCVINATKK